MKTRKSINYLLLSVFLLTFTVSGFSQNPDCKMANKKGCPQENNEKIKAQKASFITAELNLTPAEAEKFWPLYNEMQNKKEEINKDFHKLNKTMKSSNIDDLTDKQAEELANNEILHEQQLLDLKKEYHEKFKTVLTSKKIAKLYLAEKKFNRYLINQIKNKSDNKKP
jgi:hypothetical protein